MLPRSSTYSFPSLPPPMIRLVRGSRSGPLEFRSKSCVFMSFWLYGANQSIRLTNGGESLMKHELQFVPPAFMLNLPLPVMKYTKPLPSSTSPCPEDQMPPPHPSGVSLKIP